MDIDHFGEEGQVKLKKAAVLITRCGGLGGSVAYQLAAAGVGKLILAHAGDIKHSDLNRQLLMTWEGIGHPRIDSAERRLKELNPRIEIETIPENASQENAHRLVDKADLVVDCAPLFEERYALNQACFDQNKPMVEAAVNALEIHLTCLVPGQTPCLRCLYPKKSETWKRRFPVFGAVSGTAGSLAAMEIIKLISGLGRPLLNTLVSYDLGTMTNRSYRLRRNPDCPCCGEK